MISRLLNYSKSSSFFLLGARGVGKSTLIQERFGAAKDILRIDLLDLGTEDLFRSNPDELKLRLQNQPYKWVLIDEVQKLPRLLDTVHAFIEKSKIKFVLSGSSARKLKRGAANLLAGRAFVYHLHPLTATELGERFDLGSCLQWGTLPKLLQLDETTDKIEFLRAYALTYLKEEVQMEQLVRNLDPFLSFLEVAAQMNGEIINYRKIGRDVSVDTTTVQNYFSILEDTLLGFFLPAYHGSIRKRQRESPKFYFFDPGVTRALSRSLDSKLIPQSSTYGKAFEHFLILEIRRLADYARKDWRFSYLRTKDDAEIDLIIDRPGHKTICIEIKSTNTIREDHLSAFIKISEDLPRSESFCLSLDPHEKKIAHVRCLHWQEGIKALGLV